MGRKSKRKTNPAPDEASKAERKEILKLCGHIIELATKQSPPTPNEQWEEFLQINSVIEKIRKKQHDVMTQLPDRESHFPEFIDWLESNGVSIKCVEITRYEEGYGLQATQDIKMDEEVMCIPRKMMLTDQNSEDSLLGELMKTDRLLKGMANVRLAIFLIKEKLKPNSFFHPYLNILPATYSLPLYFNLAELQMLQGSPVYSETLKQHKSIARQYAYLYKLFSVPEYSKLHLREAFTYDMYRWAVATVMSRQNQIPSQDGMVPSLALIPLWDMCNHANGEMKTDFDQERDACVNMAMADFKAGEQIYICYGRRSNADLLLYSGFVYPDNSCDSMAIQLGLSSSDRLYAMKAQLCAIIRCLGSMQTFHISSGEDPVPLPLMNFLKIFCMSEVELKKRLVGADRNDLLFSLVDRSKIVSKLNELRICVYLATRVTLLLRQYKSSIEEYEERLKETNMTFHERSITQLFLCERRILENTLSFCAEWREKAEALPEGATSYQKESNDDDQDVDVAENWEDREAEQDPTETEEGKGREDEDDATPESDAVKAGSVGKPQMNGDRHDEEEMHPNGCMQSDIEGMEPTATSNPEEIQPNTDADDREKGDATPNGKPVNGHILSNGNAVVNGQHEGTNGEDNRTLAPTGNVGSAGNKVAGSAHGAGLKKASGNLISSVQQTSATEE
ncbi:actin-histidine N-methyltransferase-like [Diadema setosum]|uniref:actin-histidine N-methyltransferase-like n=1 Tax=Diadema setosum TaxID=31175 RepID=UPI003B3B8A9C